MLAVVLARALVRERVQGILARIVCRLGELVGRRRMHVTVQVDRKVLASLLDDLAARQLSRGARARRTSKQHRFAPSDWGETGKAALLLETSRRRDPFSVRS